MILLPSLPLWKDATRSNNPVEDAVKSNVNVGELIERALTKHGVETSRPGCKNFRPPTVAELTSVTESSDRRTNSNNHSPEPSSSMAMQTIRCETALPEEIADLAKDNAWLMRSSWSAGQYTGLEGRCRVVNQTIRGLNVAAGRQEKAFQFPGEEVIEMIDYIWANLIIWHTQRQKSTEPNAACRWASERIALSVLTVMTLITPVGLTFDLLVEQQISDALALALGEGIDAMNPDARPALEKYLLSTSSIIENGITPWGRVIATNSSFFGITFLVNVGTDEKPVYQSKQGSTFGCTTSAILARRFPVEPAIKNIQPPDTRSLSCLHAIAEVGAGRSAHFEILTEWRDGDHVRRDWLMLSRLKSICGEGYTQTAYKKLLDQQLNDKAHLVAAKSRGLHPDTGDRLDESLRRKAPWLFRVGA